MRRASPPSVCEHVLAVSLSVQMPCCRWDRQRDVLQCEHACGSPVCPGLQSFENIHHMNRASPQCGHAGAHPSDPSLQSSAHTHGTHEAWHHYALCCAVPDESGPRKSSRKPRICADVLLYDVAYAPPDHSSDQTSYHIPHNHGDVHQHVSSDGLSDAVSVKNSDHREDMGMV